MRLVPTTTLPNGALLARDVLVGRPDGIPLLRAGVAITPDYRDRLLRVGIRAVYIEDELGAGINPPALITTETRQAATRLVSDAFHAAGEAMMAKQLLPQRTIRSLQDIVERILADVASSAGAAMALVDLAAADSYTFQHSIDVTALGLLIGQRLFRERGWLDFRGVRQFHRLDERLHMLGLGLLLHDVGKLALPGKLLQKPAALTPDEWELMRSHPRLGLELLRGDDFSPLVKAIVLRHHERWDGSGYPDGKSGTDIHEMARIAAVADVYDAVTSQRPYAAAQPAREGVRVILEGSGTLFDPDVVEVFAQIVTPFPPGEELLLADGRRAVVVSVPEEALDRPLVRVLEGPGAPYDLALSHEPAVAVHDWPPPGHAAAAAA
jgi:HD-GYP domain-containing protein (c-di-GMP phosphodiesterase class II)